ncbi:hypothetical protein B1B_10064, partial [mine drainage metagenome]
HKGVEAFFRDWQDFTDTATPLTIKPQPRLLLVARDFEGRTRSALDFLRENSLPVMVIPVTMYQDANGRRVIDVEADHEPILPTVAGAGVVAQEPGPAASRVTVMDLLNDGLLKGDEPVEFHRPRLGKQYKAVIAADGTFELPDGTKHASPSRAAMRAAGLVSYDGWRA